MTSGIEWNISDTYFFHLLHKHFGIVINQLFLSRVPG